MTRHSLIAFGLILFTVSGALGKKESAVPSALNKKKQLALVRVNVTGQSYDYFRPWQKKAPFSKRALGAVLSKGRVLVTADLVTNQNYVELERAESGEKTAATVEVIDYEANLASLQPVEKSFLDGITPLEIAPGYGSGRPAGCMAIGADRRVTRDGGLGYNGPNDALSDRPWGISHIPHQHPDAISREQLHGAAC